MVEGSSREELLLMLLDGAIKFMGKAEEAFDAEKWDELHNQLCRVQNIFLELALSLDLDAGEFAHQLADIYGFIHALLIQANVDRDREAFDQSKRLIEEIKTMWSATIDKAGEEGPQGNGEPPGPSGPENAPKSINVTG
jgi:flagellar protein FliS